MTLSLFLHIFCSYIQLVLVKFKFELDDTRTELEVLIKEIIIHVYRAICAQKFSFQDFSPETTILKLMVDKYRGK